MLKALIVEDDKLLAASLKAAISEKFDADVCYNGLDGQKLVDKNKYDFSFDTNSIKHNIIFEVSKDLTSFSHYLGERVVEKIMLKEATGEIVEKLDI